MKTYSEDEVKRILVSVFLFAGANNKQGTTDIKGDTYGQQAQTVIDANNSIAGTGKSLISVIQQFR